MPELTPTGAVDAIERQVRRVRRRKNLYELQHALYLTIATVAGAAILLLPLALFARADLFAAAAWTTLALVAVATAALVRTARRRWLARRHAVAWIEARSALAGRVRTLLELGRRPALSAGFFHPLLVSDVQATLASWTPRRLVPRAVPGRALAGALGAALVLVALVQLASRVTPAVPPPGTSAAGGGASGEGTDLASDGSIPDDRVVVGEGEPPSRAERAAAGGRSSRLTRYSSALQETVREQVWGKAWERVRDAMARAGTTTGAERGGSDAATGEEIEAAGTDDVQLADRRAGEHGRGGASDDARNPEHDGDDPSPSASADHPAAGAGDHGEGTSGAGNATSPGDLFSGSSVDTGDTNASFELSLAARMRSDEAGRRQPGGAAPPADADARPALAADQRRESAAHRMTVPAAYEQVVREVFAHREEP